MGVADAPVRAAFHHVPIFSRSHSPHTNTHTRARAEEMKSHGDERWDLCRMCPVASNRIQISHIYLARRAVSLRRLVTQLCIMKQCVVCLSTCFSEYGPFSRRLSYPLDTVTTHTYSREKRDSNKKRTKNFSVLYLPTSVRSVLTPCSSSTNSHTGRTRPDAFGFILFINFC